MRRMTALLFLVSTALPACAHDMVLRTGGGLPGETQYEVMLDANKLTVSSAGFPLTDHGLTKKQRVISLRKDEAVRLRGLAEAAADFCKDGGDVGDGTLAQLLIDGKEVHRCSNALQWPTGPHTRALLDAINRHLPEGLHVR